MRTKQRNSETDVNYTVTNSNSYQNLIRYLSETSDATSESSPIFNPRTEECIGKSIRFEIDGTLAVKTTLIYNQKLTIKVLGGTPVSRLAKLNELEEVLTGEPILF